MAASSFVVDDVTFECTTSGSSVLVLSDDAFALVRALYEVAGRLSL